MKRSLLVAAALVLLTGLLAGCSRTAVAPAGPADSVHSWFKTEEEAVQAGLKHDNGKLLSTEKDGDVTFVFYSVQDGEALGVGSITKGDEGYKWYRGDGFHNSTGADTPFTVMSFPVKSESGRTVKVVMGRIYDNKITKLNLLLDGTILKSAGAAEPRTGLYYFMVGSKEVPAESGSLEVKEAK